jgi:hypothetical protein
MKVAAVPEAAVYENRHALGGKDDISNTTGGLPWRGVDPIAEPQLVERPTDGELRLRIPLSVRLHGSPD